MLETLIGRGRRRSTGVTAPYSQWRFDFVNLQRAAITIPEIRLMDTEGQVITQGHQANATAIGQYNASLSPPKAFDGVIPPSKDTLSHWQYNGSTFNTWLAIWIPVARPIAEYRIYMPVDNRYPVGETFQTYGPASWKLSARNSSSDPWTIVDERTGYTTPKWVERVEHQFIL